MKVLSEGHPNWHLFEFHCADFLEQFRISRKRPGAGTIWCSVKMRHSGCPSTSEASKRLRNAEGGGNICSWHATRNTRDFKPMPVGTPRASLHVSKLHTTTSGIAPRSISAPVRMKGWYAVRLFVWWDLFGSRVSTHVMGFAARSWELNRCLAIQVDTRRCLRRLFQEMTAGNLLCVFIAAPFFF